MTDKKRKSTVDLEPYIKGYSPPEKNSNGRCDIKDMDNTVYLTVYPASGSGRYLDINALLKQLKERGFIPEPALDVLNDILETVKMLNVQISNIPIDMESYNYAEEVQSSNEISVQISPDKMSAYLIINTQSIKKLVPQNILDILRNAGVVFGIKLDIVQKLCKVLSQDVYSNRLLIAIGRKAAPGKDALFKFHQNFIQSENRYEKRMPITPAQTVVALKQPKSERITTKLVTGEETNRSDERESKDKDLILGNGVVDYEREDGTIEYRTVIRGVVVLTDETKLRVIPAVDVEYTLDTNFDKTELLFDAVTGKNRVSDLSIEEIKQKIFELGVKKEFIDLTALEEAVKKLNKGEIAYISGLTVARGVKPVNGEDGRVIYSKSLKEFRKVHYREDGSVDHKLSSYIHSFKPGDPVAKIIPPNTKKKNGIDVFGKPIEAESGRLPKIILGNGTAFLQDNLTIVATMDGRVRIKGPVISIEPVLHIPGDVDYSTGSINFKGSLIVSGDVLDGFNLSATGNITVKGSVGACRIVCEGNLVIDVGINGKDKAEIFCAGNIHAGFIEQSKVEARGSIFIKNSATLSRIYSAARIVFSRSSANSVVVGCNLMAYHLIDVGKVGTERGGAESSIVLGYDYNLIRTNSRIQKRLVSTQADITKLNLAKDALEKVPNPNPDEFSKIEKQLKKVYLDYDNLLSFQNEILMRMESKGMALFIVRKAIYPDASIVMDNYKKKISEPQKACIIKKDSDLKRIIFDRYNPMEKYY